MQELNPLPTLKDTIIIYDVPPNVLEFYQNTLESTNSQLSLWFNPYAIMVATLGILFTIATVIAAIILYRQSKEFQNRYNELFQQSKNKIDDLGNRLTVATNTMLKNIKQEELEITEKLKSLKDEINHSSNSGESKDQEGKLQKLEKELNNLKDKTENFNNDYGVQTPIITTILDHINSPKWHECSNCGKKYKYKDDNYKSLAFLNSKMLKCPVCANLDPVPFNPIY